MSFAEERRPDWRECRVKLPSPENWIVLDLATEAPEAWAHAVAADHLVASASEELLVAFADDVLWYWLAAARQSAICAAVLAPPNESVVGSYVVRELQAPAAALRMDVIRAEAEKAAGPYFGSPGISQTELPAGPALRISRREPSDPSSDSGVVVEGVAHYVLPRDFPVALECRLLWTTLGLGEELGKIADELAASLMLV
jgi:hypothetical protein